MLAITGKGSNPGPASRIFQDLISIIFLAALVIYMPYRKGVSVYNYWYIFYGYKDREFYFAPRLGLKTNDLVYITGISYL